MMFQSKQSYLEMESLLLVSQGKNLGQVMHFQLTVLKIVMGRFELNLEFWIRTVFYLFKMYKKSLIKRS